VRGESVRRGREKGKGKGERLEGRVCVKLEGRVCVKLEGRVCVKERKIGGEDDS